MRIGYAALNRRLADRGVRCNRGFILRSYSPQRFRESVASNLQGLAETLRWNVERGLLAHRISSGLVPFGGHPVVTVDWQREFASELAALGEQVRADGVRLTFHPGQYTLINSPDEAVHERSVADLLWQCEVLDLMALDDTHKVQIHGGGTYGDMPTALARFAERHAALPEPVRRRLVVENDDFGIGFAEALDLHERTGVPVLLDNLHLAVTDPDLPLGVGLARAAATWRRADGPPLLDYSTQQPGKRAGTHAESFDAADFGRFLDVVAPRAGDATADGTVGAVGAGTDVDVILELKDKEAGALQAVRQLAARGGGESRSSGRTSAGTGRQTRSQKA